MESPQAPAPVFRQPDAQAAARAPKSDRDRLALMLAMVLVFTLTPEDVLGNGLGPGVIFYMLIFAALVNLLVQVMRLWLVRPR